MFTKVLHLSKISGLLRNGEIDLIDFINCLCDRIDKIEPEIFSLIPEENRRERLLNEAKQLLSMYPDKDKRPLFFGVPVGVKDIFRVDGFHTQCGSALPVELFEGEEASCVKKLKTEGALILGKTVTTEFAYFEPGPTKNPCNPKHTPGGSSSGSVAAVAAGFTPFAFGTQTIGSIIRPAAFCGVYGFKSSFGRIPTDGVIPFSPSADHVGFFTQDIEGCIMAASMLCNDWNSDKICRQSKKLIIGIPDGKYLEQASDEILTAFEKQLKVLENNGALIKRIKLFDNIDEINRMHRLMVAAEMAEVHKNWFALYEPVYRTHTKQIINEGQQLGKNDPNELYNARKGRFILRNKIESFKKNSNIDLWVSPSTLTPAPEGLESTGSPLMNLPWTYSGLPSITIPAGKSSQNLPIGLQFSGSFNEDEIMLSIVKKINDWFI